MFQTMKRIPSPPAAIGRAVAIVMLSTVAACGGGSDDGAIGGTHTSAVTQAVPSANANARPGLPRQAADAAVRVTPFDPVVNTTNPATVKLARMQCMKRARISPGVNKVPYAAASRMALRQDNCSVIMAVQQN
jgi:hypothetical protein